MAPRSHRSHSDASDSPSNAESLDSHPLAAYMQQLSLTEPVIQFGTMPETWSGMMVTLQDADEFLSDMSDPGNQKNVTKELDFPKSSRVNLQILELFLKVHPSCSSCPRFVDQTGSPLLVVFTRCQGEGSLYTGAYYEKAPSPEKSPQPSKEESSLRRWHTRRDPDGVARRSPTCQTAFVTSVCSAV